MLLDAILAHEGREVLAYYTPGHKNGRAMDPAFRDAYLRHPLAFDLGYMGAFDDLHAPKTIIAEAERAAARLYGAAASFLLTNGSTGGIVAMLLATLGPGDTVILPRNVHRCVMTALILGDFLPAFVDVEVEPSTGLPLPLRLCDVPADSWERARALLVMSPTYHGLAGDLPALAAAARRRGLSFLVDEAHGAHLPFAAGLPGSALDGGAHAAVQSTHKTLQALTPGAMLHLAADGPDPRRFRQALSMTQTSSADYAVLASLEASVRHMAGQGREQLRDAVQAVGAVRRALKDVRGIALPSPGRALPTGVSGVDPTKLVIDFRAAGLSGHQAARLLFEEEAIAAELSTDAFVLLIVTAADTPASLAELTRRLAAFAQRHAAARAPLDAHVSPAPRLAAALGASPREAFFRPQIRVSWSAAAGRIAAEPITPYPPGVPAIWPGERFDSDPGLFRNWVLRSGASIQASDSSLETVAVVA
ncbi:aminotransferase class I/II-fold pyridoxal phosphate-dependent enzyme [Sphingomonas sanguinis]|jgi:arginine decarboxylase|uniref:DegT/DnrJ/EryC1/StrS family aminotransferase n=1 Tax=Sphingomonas sanguinis TaxID=33051 RepID=A0A7Y7QXD8_9SPHN|nr:DegT/DnrJ/EryC1/StrS family aminotransferase [Sphingomonas sanguinis]MBZ6383084.1 DegT/DnrJ/EryC1/StrS family aminotransferase [Sphingomonas sanguinis]NNG48188.1 hypothetical protein [Sphingomonas sanguinis]NNG54934.1 hypothetical protein [Sphingomonas sanguinis]NVP32381.1 DegT/DnrJ/EryC1/StrS family aminotransferase [Sphingomonas sanguinis]